jgi:hypothetical protein
MKEIGIGGELLLLIVVKWYCTWRSGQERGQLTLNLIVKPIKG